MTTSTLHNGVFVLHKDTGILGVYSDLDNLFLHKQLREITMGQILETKEELARDFKHAVKFVIHGIRDKPPEEYQFFRITEISMG
jgi:hypothetical protein